jgi:hypothetical protein
MLSFDTGTHASVGAQATMGGAAQNGATRRNQLLSIANAGSSTLTARAVVGGVERGYLYQSGSFQTDVAGQTRTLAELDALAASGAQVTYTLVPNGTGGRALDRDGDGFRDGDERAACSDPADPRSTPDSTCRFDIAGDDGRVTLRILRDEREPVEPGDAGACGMQRARPAAVHQRAPSWTGSATAAPPSTATA